MQFAIVSFYFPYIIICVEDYMCIVAYTHALGKILMHNYEIIFYTRLLIRIHLRCKDVYGLNYA